MLNIRWLAPFMKTLTHSYIQGPSSSIEGPLIDIRQCVPMWLSIFILGCGCVYVSVYRCVCVCLCENLLLYVCLFMFVSVFESVSVSIHNDIIIPKSRHMWRPSLHDYQHNQGLPQWRHTPYVRFELLWEQRVLTDVRTNHRYQECVRMCPNVWGYTYYLGRNKLILCLASHGKNVNAGCGKIIYYLFLDKINQKCAKYKMNF